MMSGSTPRESELAYARPEVDETWQQLVEDGSGRADSYSSASQPFCGRRRIKLFGLVGFVLVVVIIIAVATSVSRRNGSDRSSVSAGASSNQDGAVSTTQSPTAPQTAAAPTSSPTVAPTSTPTATQTTISTPEPITPAPITPAPVTPAPITSPTDSASATAQYICEGDRIQNGVKLEANHFLCDSSDRYRFGMDDTGSLVYVDDELMMTAVVYQGSSDGNYFKLMEDATFTVNNNLDSIVWQEACEDDVSFSAACLPTNSQVYDCPYLHLHDDGVIVLNYINGGWTVRNILHSYNLTECHDSFFCQL